MSVQILRPKNREEWLELRKGGIGSSEVGTIMGLNPWETPYQLWRRKKGFDAPKEETFAMKAGHYLEEAVTKFWHDETGREIIKRSAIDWIIVNKDKPWMRVSPDRTYWLDGKKNDLNKGILECKTTQHDIDPNDIPRHWFCQVQYQLGVAGLTQGSLAWLSCGRKFDFTDIQLVPDFYKWTVEEVTKFWVDCILGDQEPPMQTAEDVLLKYDAHMDGKIVEVGEDTFADYSVLKDVREQIDELSEKKTELENKLKLCFGDAEAIAYGGTTLATWKAPKPGKKFDEKKFKAQHPALAMEFTYDYQGSRRFLLK